MIMYVVLTNDCNLNCSYCYVPESKKQQKIELDYDKAQQMIDTNKIDCIDIIGGEPMVYPDAVLKAVSQFSRPDLPVSVITNGTLITDDIVKKLMPYNFRFTVSFDGYQQKENRSDSYEQVIEGIKTILRHMDSSRLRINIAVPPDGVDSVLDSVRLIAGLGVTHIKLYKLLGSNYPMESAFKLASMFYDLMTEFPDMAIRPLTEGQPYNDGDCTKYSTCIEGGEEYPCYMYAALSRKDVVYQSRPQCDQCELQNECPKCVATPDDVFYCGWTHATKLSTLFKETQCRTL